jgi:hypothetical protein
MTDFAPRQTMSSSDTPRKKGRSHSKGESRNENEFSMGAETERDVIQTNPGQKQDSVSIHQDYSDEKPAQPDRVGDLTGQPPTNRAVDKVATSRLANLLEGLDFPVTKKQITRHINAGPHHDNVKREIMSAIENKLDNSARYDSAYDVELAVGLVKSSEDAKPYVRDKALNRANRRRIGEELRTDPYENYRESVGVASKEDVSPNTPRGESI